MKHRSNPHQTQEPYFKIMKLDLALLLRVTGSILLIFVFHQHFYKGLCMCSRHVEELCRVWRNPRSGWRWQKKNVCACGPGQQTFPGWHESARQPEVAHSIRRATSVQWLESWVGQVMKAFQQPLAHKNRKDSFSEERLSDWLKRIKRV